MNNKKEVQEKIVRLLQENPIIQVACYKASIARSTFYRWQKEDEEFKKICNQSRIIGLAIVNDAIESVLIKKAREGNERLIMYWLNNNHKKYKKTYQGLTDKKYDLLKSLEEEKIKQEAITDKKIEGLNRLFNLAREMEPDKEQNILVDNFGQGIVSA